MKNDSEQPKNKVPNVMHDGNKDNHSYDIPKNHTK